MIKPINFFNISLKSNDGWSSKPYEAFICMRNNELYYIGGTQYDLTKLDNTCWAEIENKKYQIIDAQKTVCDDMPLLVTAKLKIIND